jgi:hypothetical protein
VVVPCGSEEVDVVVDVRWVEGAPVVACSVEEEVAAVERVADTLDVVRIEYVDDCVKDIFDKELEMLEVLTVTGRTSALQDLLCNDDNISNEMI